MRPSRTATDRLLHLETQTESVLKTGRETKEVSRPFCFLLENLNMQSIDLEASISSTFGAVEISNSFLESAIGNTPLIRLRRVTQHLRQNVEVLAKAEFLNPGGSVKDRPALAMILAGEKSGELTLDKSILDATSGNTGIAYAMIGAARGYPVTLALPKNASAARQRILRIYGAELVLTD